MLVILHEFGHFLMAKYFGITPTEFNVGFGPKIWSKVKKGTAWNVRAIPAGGYCLIDDQDLHNLHPAKQIAIFAAGPFTNFVLALAAYYIAYILYGNFNIFAAIKGAITTMVALLSTIGPSIVSSLSIGNNTRTMAETSQYIVGTIASQTTIAVKIAYFMDSIYVLNALLFICNIVPIPALDGGHILFTIPELFGKKINSKIKNGLTSICYYAILAFSIIYFAKDILLQAWRVFMAPH